MKLLYVFTDKNTTWLLNENNNLKNNKQIRALGILHELHNNMYIYIYCLKCV